MNLLVTNIQRLSLDDGPGVRTTVFLKGCSIKCPWCSNPENQLPYPEIFLNKRICLREKGIDCRRCLADDIYSPENYLNFNRRKNVGTYIARYKNLIENCPTNALGVYGREIDLRELLAILEKDKTYFKKTGGGITFSGGEPLLYDLSPWLKELKTLGYHICVETSLYVPFNNLEKSMDCVDLYIVDIKVLSREKAWKVLKGDIEVFFRNVSFLMKLRKRDIWFRFPVVDGYTNTEENIHLLLYFINRFNIRYLEVFSIHNLSTEKYLSLGRDYRSFTVASDKDLENLKQRIERATMCRVRILNM